MAGACSSGGSNDSGTLRSCLVIDRMSATVAMASSRMTTSAIGEVLPNSSPRSDPGAGGCAWVTTTARVATGEARAAGITR